MRFDMVFIRFHKVSRDSMRFDRSPDCFVFARFYKGFWEGRWEVSREGMCFPPCDSIRFSQGFIRVYGIPSDSVDPQIPLFL